MATEYIFVISSYSYEILRVEKFAKLEEEKRIKPENEIERLFRWFRGR